MNLGVGAYRDEAGKPVILEVVKEAEERLLKDPSSNHEYLPIGGIPEFCAASAELAFGSDSAALREGRNATIQSLSGTGSLRVGAEFLAKFYPKSKVVLVPNPSWANHRAIFDRAGLQVQLYRYYKPEARGLDFEVRFIHGGGVYCVYLFEFNLYNTKIKKTAGFTGRYEQCTRGRHCLASRLCT